MKWGPFGLDGRAAIVTGGARGIGRATASRLAEAGAMVLVVDLDGQAVEGAVSSLTEAGARADGLVVDITDEHAPDAVVARCVDAFGRLDILVNNAGIYPPAALSDTDQAFIERVLRLNVTALLLLARAAVPSLAAAGSGAIVNVASIDGIAPTGSGFTAYAASKGAVLAATRALAVELAGHGIRVNAVSPSGTLTEGVRGNLDAMTQETRNAALSMLTAKTPMGRLAEPDDVATVVTFFASDASRYVTGANLLVDGGQLRGPA